MSATFDPAPRAPALVHSCHAACDFSKGELDLISWQCVNAHRYFAFCARRAFESAPILLSMCLVGFTRRASDQSVSRKPMHESEQDSEG